jgi:hypothetical protein
MDWHRGRGIHSTFGFSSLLCIGVLTWSTSLFSVCSNGSIARLGIKELVKEGLIKEISSHKSQLIFTRSTAEVTA